jgi:hypothetical protein
MEECMSTAQVLVVEQELDGLDERREELIVKLGWWKRVKRRYLTGDSFKSYQISSLMTWPQAFTAGLSASVLWGKFSLAFPVAATLLTKVWGGITTTLAAIGAFITSTA